MNYNVERIDPLMGTFATMKALAFGADRSEALTDTVGSQTVDTNIAFDTGRWETAIRRDDSWIIVEQYPLGADYAAGHRSWVDKLSSHPEMDLIDIDLWGLNQL